MFQWEFINHRPNFRAALSCSGCSPAFCTPDPGASGGGVNLALNASKNSLREKCLSDNWGIAGVQQRSFLRHPPYTRHHESGGMEPGLLSMEVPGHWGNPGVT